MSERYSYYWEDFYPGRRFETGSKILTREQIVDFARDYDPQPFHVNQEAAERSPYGGLIASGWQTCALAMRMICDCYLLESASLGSPGIDGVRWLKPVRPDDRLHVNMTVLEQLPSRSKPDRGFVRSKWEMHNEDGEVVMTLEGTGMFRRRHPG